MKEETINTLIQKYKNADTSLKDEQKLFNNLKEEQIALTILGDFINSNQINAPHNLNATLWKAFDEKKDKKNSFKIGVFSVAASIVLMVSLYVGNLNDNKLSNSQKKALLQEAKNMFLDVELTKTVHKIIIESDLIVVYTKSE